jgi:hypothetical protein
VSERTRETVAITGAGIGGLYLAAELRLVAAELGIAGFKVRLHDIDASKLSELQARGGIEIEGDRGGFAAIERATTNLGSAVDGAAVIMTGKDFAAEGRTLDKLGLSEIDKRQIQRIVEKDSIKDAEAFQPVFRRVFGQAHGCRRRRAVRWSPLRPPDPRNARQTHARQWHDPGPTSQGLCP